MTHALIAAAFVAAWLAATAVVCRRRWLRVMPGFSALVFFSAVQAVSVVQAGAEPPDAWWVMVWAPVECIVLQAAFYATLEVCWSRWWMLGGATAATALLPHDLIELRVWFTATKGLPGWYHALILAREWVWIAVAVTLIAHSLWLLLAHPVRLPTGVYRSRWLFGAYAASIAVMGREWPGSPGSWLDRQEVWRLMVVVILAAWCCLTSSAAPQASSGPDRLPPLP